MWGTTLSNFDVSSSSELCFEEIAYIKHLVTYEIVPVGFSCLWSLASLYSCFVKFFFRWFLSCFFWRDGKSFLSRAAVVESLSACMVWTSHPSSFIRYNIAEAISGSMALLEPKTQKLIHINYVNTDKLKVLWLYLKKIIHFLFFNVGLDLVTLTSIYIKNIIYSSSLLAYILTLH